MGHDNERAALRYQHRSAKGDRAIADGLAASSIRSFRSEVIISPGRPGLLINVIMSGDVFPSAVTAVRGAL